MKKLGTLFFSALALIMVITTGLLILEYRFFKQQSQQIFAARLDYHNHLAAVKKVLSDYNYLKELFEQRDNQEDEKKKTNYGLGACADSFPEGAKVFSSDDNDGQDSFLVINRELEYLKQSSLEYLKQHDLDMLVQRISPDEWRDYNEYVKERKEQVQQKKKKKNARKRVVSGSSSAKKPIIAKNKPKKDFHFSWPIKRSDFWISSVFGPRKKPNGSNGFHHGIDMAAVKGTPVKAAAGGVIVEAGYKSGYGNTIVIAHNRKYRTRYAHLHKICTRVGNKVERGDLIGRVGDTGSVRSKKGGDASHLHFEVHAFGKQINPIYFLS